MFDVHFYLFYPVIMDNILKYYILLHFIATFGPNNEILNFNQNFALPEGRVPKGLHICGHFELM